MKNIYLFKVEQPIGTFYIAKMNSNELISIAYSNRRTADGIGNQRKLRGNRVEAISKYCEDPDATFPTPIILAVNDDNYTIEESNLFGIYKFSYNDTLSAEILDGQHRLMGIKSSGKNIQLPIVLMFNMTEEEKAYIFSTINSNQQKVDKSLIYDLFELSTKRSPYKTCHEIARLLNSRDDSPFYNRLKMLESRRSKDETLSQGTFVNYLCTLISYDPKKDMIDIKNNKKIKDNQSLPLRYYFINDSDGIIFKIIFNCFSAVKKVFKTEWDEPNKYILSKTTGFGGIIKSLKEILPKCQDDGDYTLEKFLKVFENLKTNLINKNIELTSKYFSSGEQGQNKLSKLIIESYN